ncbi:hypothetical protein [Pseudomonas umsongensis]|uniref:hypothetical protein n=1 Tax=Pseudomonas umsongensis TaxID=198618 RepID=UPI00200A735E|nr:hypothetical protein [Pseudomonas umsongensis]MCK8683458.1 hypothetical protein [Pseudomonas umsongensis]
MNTAIDSCEQIETAGFNEMHRCASVQIKGLEYSVQEFRHGTRSKSHSRNESLVQRLRGAAYDDCHQAGKKKHLMFSFTSNHLVLAHPGMNVSRGLWIQPAARCTKGGTGSLANS